MAFVRYIPRPAEQASTLDFSNLDRLKRGLYKSDGRAEAAQAAVAHQFEALFLQQLLKQARQASGPDSLFDSAQTRMAQSLRDEQMASALATPGIGLAQALLDQMRGHNQAVANEDAGSPPELAASRLPVLRSRIGDEARQYVASSITALLGRLTGHSVADGIIGAIEGAPRHIRDFVSSMADAARSAARESGLPEKLVLSQAALESGWGKREIRREDGSTTYNLFGIKAGGNWHGKVVEIMTTEYRDGVPVKIRQPFRAYDSYAESFADYARLISGNSRYSAVAAAGSAEEAARRIQEAGYATDPAYASKLISIMGYFETASGAGGRESA